jgi:hypothetical protein
MKDRNQHYKEKGDWHKENTPKMAKLCKNTCKKYLQNEDLFHKSSWNKKATREEWHKLMNTLFEKADLRRHQY